MRADHVPHFDLDRALRSRMALAVLSLPLACVLITVRILSGRPPLGCSSPRGLER